MMISVFLTFYKGTHRCLYVFILLADPSYAEQEIRTKHCESLGNDEQWPQEEKGNVRCVVSPVLKYLLSMHLAEL